MEAIRVHETAFMTAYFRSHFEKISCDPYSKLWLSERTKHWCDEYLAYISPTEAIAHALRNRFFYQQLHNFSSKNKYGLVVNLGAGFSMYPYLLPPNIRQVEIDQPQVVRYKDQKTAEWQRAELLPPRQVQRYACNLSDVTQLSEILLELKKENTPCFILIEGVFFYLKETAILAIFEESAAFQQSGDIFGAVSFEAGVISHAPYQKLVDYFVMKGNFDNLEFTNPPHSFYNNIKGYSLNFRSSVLDFYAELKLQHDLKKEEVLNEYFYILERGG